MNVIWTLSLSCVI